MRFLVLILLCFGCARTIGDGCSLNVDCSPQGDRFCDIASPGGYCTVEGCDYQTCPDGANCVRFFNLQRTRPCRDAQGCRPGESCVCDRKDPKGACQSAYCASETTERRWCMHPCGGNGDCRAGYGCFQTGENGAIAVPYRQDDGTLVRDPAQISYCAPLPMW